MPDTLVEKDGERIYVEVELGYGNQARWRNMADALGYVAFYGRSGEQVKAVWREMQMGNIPLMPFNLPELMMARIHHSENCHAVLRS